MKASSTDIKFYKGVLLEQIHKHLVSTGTYFSLEETDNFLKAYADLSGSCLSMSHEELQILKEYSKQFAESIGCVIKNID